MTMTTHDLIIIGGGPAGLTAGLYAARARMNVALIEKMGCGGQAIIADWIENYPGFPEGISGFELSQRIEAQARKFDLPVVSEEVTGILRAPEGSAELTVRTTEKEYKTSALIISSGARHKMLDVPGELEFHGRGVSYCATCDGPFFKEKDVVVVGGGNSAVQEALFLTRFAKSVTIVHRRDRLRATQLLQERAKNNPKISFAWNSSVTSLQGTETLATVNIRNLSTNRESTIAAEGIFIFVGLTPATEFVKGIVSLDESGYVITDDEMRTSAKGVFA